MNEGKYRELREERRKKCVDFEALYIEQWLGWMGGRKISRKLINKVIW